MPTLKNMLLGRRVVAELYLERLPLSEVPDDPDEASAWLHEHYRHKVSQLAEQKRIEEQVQTIQMTKVYLFSFIGCIDRFLQDGRGFSHNNA